MKMSGWLVALAMSAAAPVAGATTVDFSATPVGCFDSYTEGDVTFTAVDGLGLTSTDFGNTPEGSIGILGCGTLPDFSMVRADFSRPFTGTVSVALGDFGLPDADQLSLSLFGAGSALLAHQTLTIPADFDGMTTLVASAPAIRYAIFGAVAAEGSSVYADDFTFEGRFVPEPATGALLALGMLAAAVARRRMS
jgi:hypothetical protein